MSNKFEQFIVAIRSLGLRPDEKASLRIALVGQMHQTRPYFLAGLYFRRLSLALASLLLVVGASASLAAEGSLPGDLLYPIKVAVNEKVRGTLAVTPEARATWSATVAARRLDEAESLATLALLTPSARTELQTGFHQAASELQDNLAALPPGETFVASNITNNFKATLRAHGRILADIDRNNQSANAVGGEVASLIASVKKEEDSVGERETKFARGSDTGDDRSTLRAATDARMVAEKKVAEVERLVEDQKPKLDSENSQKLDRRLHSVLEQLSNGQASLVGGQSVEALSSFQAASSLAEETKVLLKAKNDLEKGKPTPAPQERKAGLEIDLGL